MRLNQLRDFKRGELVVRINDSNNRCRVGKIKELTGRGAYVYFNESTDAQFVEYSKLYKVTNSSCITECTFGDTEATMAERDLSRFLELTKIYRVCIKQKTLKPVNPDEYDIIIEKCDRPRDTYQNTATYKVLMNVPRISNDDIALICARGVVKQGYRFVNNLLHLYV